MQIATFIVLDDPLKGYSKTQSRTVNGEVYYPLETPMPIILKGKGCIGIGMVNEMTISTSSTTIVFVASKISDNDANAYYALYRNQVSVSSNTSSDLYEQSDAIIPGMMTSINRKQHQPEPRRRNRSLMDYVDDDYDDY